MSVTTRYAENTTVASDRSRAEIERTLTRYKARAFAYAWDDDHNAAVIMFKISNRQVRMQLPLPDRNAEEFTHTRHKDRWRRQLVSAEQAEARWEQASRQRWRALALVIKAKLEAVEAGISTVEREFLADVLLPNGATVGAWAAPQLESVYAGGQMPALMPGVSRG